jgi:hypothetical protein
MKSKRTALLAAAVFVATVTTLHWFVNIQNSKRETVDAATRFRVGFLPVT